MDKHHRLDPEMQPAGSPPSVVSSKEASENSLAHQQALMNVVDEAARLFHFLNALTSHMYTSESMSTLCRTLLHDLVSMGAQSVPSLARAQNVTRQSIQARVNMLAKDGFVTLVPNPAHKRSPLVTLTAQGKHLWERMEQQENEILARVHFRVSVAQLQATAENLQTIRVWLTQEQQRLQMGFGDEDT
jgi:DNA-binding MarR family transcriptional regulator